jgi:cGMP-dependent protein kinase
MGKCTSKEKSVTNGQPRNNASTPKSLKSPEKTQPSTPSKPLAKALRYSAEQTQFSKNLAKSGAQATGVKSRPAVENPSKDVTKTLSRSTTLRPTLVRKFTTEASSATISKVVPNQQVQKELVLVLKSHFLFNMLSEDAIMQMVKEMKSLMLEPGQLIYRQGNYGNTFYVVEKGKVDVLVDGVPCNSLMAKQSFGELGLIQDTPRTNTVVTAEKSSLRSIDRNSYRNVLTKVYSGMDEEGVGFLEVIPLFKTLSASQLNQLANVTTTKKYMPGDKIIIEGEMGDSLFIVKEGVVDCSKYDQHIRDFNKGDFFGEQGLLYQTKRTATCTAAGKATCICISRSDLVACLGVDLEAILSKNTIRIAITRNQFLKNLSEVQVDMVFGKMSIKSYKPGEIILPKSTLKSSNLLIILKGCLTTGDTKFRLYDLIGDEEFLLENCKRFFRNDLTAEQESTVAMIPRVTFEEIIGGNLKFISQKNSLITILKKIPLFKNLPQSKLQSLVSVLRVEEFPAQSIIFNQGDLGDKFYLVKSGSVEIVKNGESIRKVEVNGFFGERSVLLNEPRAATAVTIGNTSCWVMNKIDFSHFVDGKAQEDLRKRIELLNDNFNLNDLIYLKTMSKGKNSKSFLVFMKNTSKMFFLRTVSRNSLALFNGYEKILMERNILKMIDHPFIGKLIKTFKDNLRIYFLMEFVPGQDLFDVLADWNKMGNENAKFYAAGIVIILEYLHSYNIVYRDLKPENILIDSEGYPKICDFTFSKIIENRTYSIVGTPHYMAPEVISGKGYNHTADYWSLGVMIYEFLFNSLPFAANASDLYSIYQSVLIGNFNYPSGTHTVKPLLDKLLVKNPNMRGNIKNIKENPWFIGINWDDYITKQLNAPRKPKINNYDKQIAGNNGKNELFLKISVRFT